MKQTIDQQSILDYILKIASKEPRGGRVKIRIGIRICSRIAVTAVHSVGNPMALHIRILRVRNDFVSMPYASWVLPKGPRRTKNSTRSKFTTRSIFSTAG